MRDRQIKTIGIVLFLLSAICFEGYSQKKVTYFADKQPLNVVLTKVSGIANVRFAFDDDYLSKIIVSVTAKGVSVDDFLKQLSLKYPITYRLIGTTWVIFRDERIVTVKEKPKVEKQGETEEAKPLKKREQKISRLWDLDGIIVDSKTGNRLMNSGFYVDKYTNPQTNELGFFSDETVGTGDVRAFVQKEGYYPLDTLLNAKDDKDIVIKLNPLSQVGIADNENFTEFPLYLDGVSDRISFNHCMGTNPNGKEITDFSNFFQYLPGIQFGTEMEIRDIAYSPSNILIDGVPILNKAHLFSQVSAMNADYIHQSFVSRGGLDADQSGNSSGLVDIRGKNGFGKPRVSLTATLIDASLFVGIPFSTKLSFSVAARKSVGNYLPNFLYKSLSEETVAVLPVSSDSLSSSIEGEFSTYHDLNAKLTYQPNTRNEINLVYHRGFDDQQRNHLLSIGDDYFLDTRNRWYYDSFGLNWKSITKNNWNNSFQVSAFIAHQREWYKSGITRDLQGQSFNLTGDSVASGFSSLAMKWKSEFSTQKITHLVGAELNHINSWNHFRALYSTIFSNPYSLIDSFSANNLANQAQLFYHVKIAPFKWVNLSAGVRGLYVLGLDRFYLQPRLSMKISPVEPLSFYYHFGQEVLTLSHSYRFDPLYRSTNIWEVATADRNVLTSWQHLVGINYSSEGLLIEAEGYRNTDEGLSAYFPVVKVAGSAQAPYRRIEGVNLRQGLEVMMHYQHSIFHHSLAYSFSTQDVVYDAEEGKYTILELKHYNHRLKLTELVRYSGWVALAKLNYCYGTSYSTSSANKELIPSAINMDVSLSKQFVIGKSHIEAGATLLNLFNSKPRFEKNYYELGGENRSEMVLLARQQFGIVPSFYVLMKWN